TALLGCRDRTAVQVQDSGRGLVQLTELILAHTVVTTAAAPRVKRPPVTHIKTAQYRSDESGCFGFVVFKRPSRGAMCFYVVSIITQLPKPDEIMQGLPHSTAYTQSTHHPEQNYLFRSVYRHKGSAAASLVTVSGTRRDLRCVVWTS